MPTAVAVLLLTVPVLLASASRAASTGAVASPTGASARSSAASAVSAASGAEGDFVSRINSLRASRGLGALSVDPELTAAARSWASTMAAQGRIFHSSDLSSGISARWAKLGENVGVGGDVASLFQAFVDSPSHYENLVDPAYTRVGVGVVMSGGRMYTAHRFMAVAAAPAPPPPPPSTAPTTTAPPPPPPVTAPPTTAAPTTAPPTTAPPAATTTSTTPPEPTKFGRLDRIRELIEGG